MLTGLEEMLLPCLVMGGKGCTAAAAGMLPEVMVGIYLDWQAGDRAAALKR